MKLIDVCFSPDLIGNYDLEGKSVVVVDILRATSCMTTGIASGVHSITPFESVDACLEKKGEGYIIAGERGGKKVEGFDIGNSPFSYMEERYRGRRIAVTTTNGTRAIASSVAADEILIGSFLNLSTIANYLNDQDRDVLVYCAGWKGRVSLEDTLFAGALVKKLPNFAPADDSVGMAKALYNSAEKDLLQVVSQSGHAKRLSEFNVIKDIEFCVRIDEYTVLPVIENGVIVRSPT